MTPGFDTGGLVSALPSVTDSWLVDRDDPFYQNYRWIAMLNPIELTRSAHDHESTTTVPFGTGAVWDWCRKRTIQHHAPSATRVRRQSWTRRKRTIPTSTSLGRVTR